MSPERPRRFAGTVRPRRRTDLLTAKVTPKQLRGPRWVRTSHGLYLPAGVTSDGPAQRIVEMLPRVPSDGAIGGWGAAWALGADQCDGLGPDGCARLPVPLCVGDRRHPIRGVDGADVWYDRLADEDIVEVDGVRVTAGPRTCFDGIRRASNLTEAVVFADQMSNAGVVTLGDVRTYVAQHPRWDGVPQARRALELADPMARNAWETRLRMVWVLVAELPRPLCNPPLFDLRGNLLGYPDLLDQGAATVGEFDGRLHRGLARHGEDNVREELFEDHALVVTRAISLDFADEPALAVRMRRVHARGRRRDRRFDRWTLEAPPDWEGVGADHELDDVLDAMDAAWQRPW